MFLRENLSKHAVTRIGGTFTLCLWCFAIILAIYVPLSGVNNNQPPLLQITHSSLPFGFHRSYPRLRAGSLLRFGNERSSASSILYHPSLSAFRALFQLSSPSWSLQKAKHVGRLLKLIFTLVSREWRPSFSFYKMPRTWLPKLFKHTPKKCRRCV